MAAWRWSGGVDGDPGSWRDWMMMVKGCRFWRNNRIVILVPAATCRLAAVFRQPRQPRLELTACLGLQLK